ncbi:MAG: DUF4442 domain-containing protein [Cytophagales bacterium]|nr:DUF4442 domain-containing protein [Cytophagales bacterium]
MNLNKIIEKSKYSDIYRRILNVGLNLMVPFNKPHGFKIVKINDYHLKTMVPYKRANFNHIKGIHACALATLSEFTTGFLLLTKLDPKKYRLIMQCLKMEYNYQAKMDSFADFAISGEWLDEMIYRPLASTEKVVVDCEVKIHDKAGNHISTGAVKWQIKLWDRVKTKV